MFNGGRILRLNKKASIGGLAFFSRASQTVKSIVGRQSFVIFAKSVGPVAGPGIICRITDQAAPYRGELDIAVAIKYVAWFAGDAAAIAAFPQRARSTILHRRSGVTSKWTLLSRITKA